MLNEDRKMLAAVQREKERIAVGVEIITQALRKGGRIIFVGAGTSGRLGVLESAEMPPTFGTEPGPGAGDHGRRQGRDPRARKEGVEDNYEEGARVDQPPAADQEGRRHRRVGERHDAVRPRRADRARGAPARRSSSSPAIRAPSCRPSSI